MGIELFLEFLGVVPVLDARAKTTQEGRHGYAVSSTR
jgi:hypothetical protein